MEYYLVLADILPDWKWYEWVAAVYAVVFANEYFTMRADVKRLNKEFEILEKETRVSFLGVRRADRLIYDQIAQKAEYPPEATAFHQIFVESHGKVMESERPSDDVEDNGLD